MYHTCIYCKSDLRANEVLEHFPVGRRVAFDAAKGRLWAVCPRCERWNLAPFEERWEAIEQAERAYRDTKTRVATDEIGLAKLGEGLELVRIGRPLLPEMAAWRYGDQFGRRRVRRLALSALGVGAVATGIGVGVTAGAAALVLVPMANVMMNLALLSGGRGLKSLRIEHPDGREMIIGPMDRANARLVATNEEEPWAIEVPYSHLMSRDPDWRERFNAMQNRPEIGRVRFTGARGMWVAGQLLPGLNTAGASAKRVREAVTLLSDAGGPEGMYRQAPSRLRAWAAQQTFGDSGALAHLPKPVRLALEMAAHEENERRALAGELAELERAWRDAEEVAAIADDLLTPPTVRERLKSLRDRASG